MSSPDTPELRTIYLYLTGSCNLACRHCWINPRHESAATNVMPLDTIRHIVEQARDLGLVSVKLTGGEPLLYPQAIDLIRYLHDSGIGVVIETNGTLLGPAEAAALAAAHAEVAVSLDGPEAAIHEDLRQTRGSFDAALAGMKALREAKIGFQIITCLYRANCQAVMRMPAFARELGATSVKINPVTGITRSAVMKAAGELLSIAEILDLHRRMRAEAATQRIAVHFSVPPAFQTLEEIGQSGVHTCGIHTILGVLHSGHASLCGIGEVVAGLDMGDLAVVPIREVWEHNPILKEIRAMVPKHLGGICGRCVLKGYCLGLCLAHDFAETGAMFGGHAFCAEAHTAGLFPVSRLVDPVPEVAAA